MIRPFCKRLAIVVGALIIASPVTGQDEMLGGFANQQNKDPRTSGKPDPAQAAAAPKKTGQNATTEQAEPKPAPAPISEERKAELMTFVRQNHAELERLINSLKNKRPVQYQAALRYLDKSVTNLANIKKTQSEERYTQAVEDWKLRSRIQVLSAQLTITDTPERRKQLADLFAKQLENRARQLKSDIEKTRVRLERLEKAAADIEANREAMVAKQMDLVIKSVERNKALQKRASEKKPADIKKPEPAANADKAKSSSGNGESESGKSPVKKNENKAGSQPGKNQDDQGAKL